MASATDAEADTLRRSDGPGDEGLGLDPGAQLGRYVILERLAAGGMGEVYAAWDPQLNRRIALKVMRGDLAAGLGAAEGQERLRREAQAMARLAHPNLVAVHDVGTTGNQVFVAMEFVEGQTLRSWLDERPRTPREIIAAFIEAGRGLAAAHQDGLVHRDFKPQNAMVRVDGRVCVLDFGLARLASSPMRPAPEATPPSAAVAPVAQLTQAGAVMGTPAYMSWEQLRGLPADARADQFSFAVALYEALAGERPFRGNTLQELAADVGAGRAPTPTRRGAISAHVLAVLQRALAREPNARFPTMDALLAELERDPRARRRRLSIAAATAVGLLSLVGVRQLATTRSEPCRAYPDRAAALWNASTRGRAQEAFQRTQAPTAAHAWKEVDRAVEQYLSTWAERARAACLTTERTEEQRFTTLACYERRLQQAAALASVLATADALVVQNAPNAARSLEPLGSCDDGDAMAAQPAAPDPKLAAAVQRARVSIADGRALLWAGKYKEGLGRAEALSSETKALGYKPAEAEALLLLADLHGKLGDFKAAERAAAAAASAAQAAGWSLGSASAFLVLTQICVATARPDEAERWANLATGTLDSIRAPDEVRGDLERARFEFEKLGGQWARAVEHGKASLALYERALPREHPRRAELLRGLAYARAQSGDLAGALSDARAALVLQEARLGSQHIDVGRALATLGAIESDADELEPALKHQQGALHIFETAFGRDDRALAPMLNNLGLLLVDLRRFDEADAALSRALAIATQSLGAEHGQLAYYLDSQGASAFEQGKFEQALALFARARELHARALGPGHVRSAGILAGVGRSLVRLGRPKEAVEPLTQAVALRDKEPGRPTEAGRARFWLARALVASGGDQARADALLAAARSDFARGGRRGERELAQLHAWQTEAR